MDDQENRAHKLQLTIEKQTNLMAQENQITSLFQKAKERRAESQIFISGNTASPEASFQRLFRALAENADVLITKLAIAESKSNQYFDHVSLIANGEGSLESLQFLLLTLNQSRPIIRVDSLDLTRSPSNNDQTRLKIVLGISAIVDIPE